MQYNKYEGYRDPQTGEYIKVERSSGYNTPEEAHSKARDVIDYLVNHGGWRLTGQPSVERDPITGKYVVEVPLKKPVNYFERDFSYEPKEYTEVQTFSGFPTPEAAMNKIRAYSEGSCLEIVGQPNIYRTSDGKYTGAVTYRKPSESGRGGRNGR